MYKDIYDFSNLLTAYKKARSGKVDSPISNKFEINMLEYIICLSDQLRNKTYKPGNTTKFKVYCPKERDIESNTFRDKVVHTLFVIMCCTPLFSLNSFWTTMRLKLERV